MKCAICHQDAGYKCPYCGVDYCSTKCFKLHSTECTEKFYKQQVLDSVLNGEASDDMKQKVKDLLIKEGFDPTKDGLDDDEDDEETKNLMKALELLENGNAEDAEKLLSDAQKAAFREALQKGELSIDYWEPWWNVPLVDGAENNELCFPPLPHDVVPLEQKMKGKPLHESVKNNIPELIFAYCYALRLNDGGPDFGDDKEDIKLVREIFSHPFSELKQKIDDETFDQLYSIVEDYVNISVTMLHISDVLMGKLRRPYESEGAAIKAAIMAAQQIPYGNPIQFSNAVVDDVAIIFRSRNYCIRALGHAKTLLEQSYRFLKNVNSYQMHYDVEKICLEDRLLKALKESSKRISLYISLVADKTAMPSDSFLEISEKISLHSVNLKKELFSMDNSANVQPKSVSLTEINRPVTSPESLSGGIDFDELD